MGSFRKCYLTLVVVTSSSLNLLAGGSAAEAGEPGANLSGTWKLVVMAFGDDEYAAIRIDRKDGKDRAFVLNAQASVLGLADNLNVESLATDAGTISFTLKGPSSSSQFQGKLAGDGPSAGQFLGTFHIRNEIFPARLERTQEARLADRRPSPLIRSFAAAARNPDPVAKVDGLRQALRRYKGNPTNYLYYGEILGTAAAAEMPVEEVKGLIDEMIKDAEPHGEAWVQEVRLKALKMIGMARPYAEVTFGLARDADRLLAKDARIEQQAAVVAMLARTAALAGKAEIARDAEARSIKLERQVDEEYDKSVPPFAPNRSRGGRSQGQWRRPYGALLRRPVHALRGDGCRLRCAREDVQTFGVIGLQYHLHIPGFDALTNKDTEARRVLRRGYRRHARGVLEWARLAAGRRPDERGGGEVQGVSWSHRSPARIRQGSEHHPFGQALRRPGRDRRLRRT